MSQSIEELKVSIGLDTIKFKDSLKDLEGLGKKFGADLTSSLAKAIVDGEKLSDVFKKVAL